MTVESDVRQREQEWVIRDVSKEISSSIKDGLEECLGRLCEKHSGFKLVVSSSKSEHLKGIITRAGTGLEHIDLRAKISSINGGKPFSIKLNDGSDYPLNQAVDAANFLSEAMQVILVWFETSSRINNGEMMRVRVSEVLSFIRSAIKTLKQPESTMIFPLRVTDKSKFIDLPENIVLDVFIEDSAIVTDMRAVEYVDVAGGGFGFLFKKKEHAIPYNGRKIVEVERVKVESQDPNLISVAAKLTALETHLETVRRKLDVCLDVA